MLSVTEICLFCLWLAPQDSSASKRVHFFAADVDCCEPRRSFACGDAAKPSVCQDPNQRRWRELEQFKIHQGPMPNDIQAWYPSNSLAFCFFCFDFFHSDAMCTWFTSMMGICSKKVVWVSTYIKHLSLGRYFVWQVILDRDGAVNSRRIYIILYLLIRRPKLQYLSPLHGLTESLFCGPALVGLGWCCLPILQVTMRRGRCDPKLSPCWKFN